MIHDGNLANQAGGSILGPEGMVLFWSFGYGDYQTCASSAWGPTKSQSEILRSAPTCNATRNLWHQEFNLEIVYNMYPDSCTPCLLTCF